MRLINTSTYDLEEFVAEPKPYAILSHTWRDKKEILFADYKDATLEDKQRHKKVEYLCSQAREHGLQYAWIDTVCIDKSSSAELSEAINSMYQWYHDAHVCYVYLDDTEDIAGLETCRWITRGWTLQELLAPSDVRFFNKSWNLLGTKSSLLPSLVKWTGIDQAALEAAKLIPYFSAACRMSWAASRSTTRVEDMAYCLLGIFGIAMPLLYGERERAFQRLQEEILRQSCDTSILVFDRSEGPPGDPHFLASNPTVFGKAPRVVNDKLQRKCKITSMGIKTRVQVLTVSKHEVYGFLPFRFEFNTKDCVGIRIYPVRSSKDLPEYCFESAALRLFTYIQIEKLPSKEVLLHKVVLSGRTALPQIWNAPSREVCCLHVEELLLHGYEIVYAGPENGVASWNERTLTSEVIWERNPGAMVRKFGFINRDWNEAFIVMLAIASESARGYFMYLSTSICPAASNCHAWLEENGAYSVCKLSDSQQRAWWNVNMTGPKEVVIDDDTWVLVAYKDGDELIQSFRSCNIDLCADGHIPCVELTVEPLKRVPDGWSITVEPGSGPHDSIGDILQREV